MNVITLDLGGVVDYAVFGDTVFFDKKNTAKAASISLASYRIRKWAAEFYDRPLDPYTLIPALDTKLQQYFAFEQIYISDKKGYYFNADGQTENIVDRRYFMQAMHGLPVISEPIINRSTFNIVIAVAAPIYRYGKVSGLFGITVQIA